MEAGLPLRELPFAGLRVLQIGRSLAGLMLGKLLGDQGALVFYVDTSCSDEMRYVESWQDDVSWLKLDLTAPADTTELAELIRDSDVVVDSAPRETLAAAGFTADRLREMRPNVLHCSLRPFPAEAAAELEECNDWLVAAELGLFQVGNAQDPTMELLPIPSAYAAIQAVLYISAALAGRREGQGGDIHISLFGAGILDLNGELQNIDSRYSDSRATHHSDERNTHGFGLSDRYLCGDGRYIQPHGRSPGVCSATLRGLGRPEWVDDAVASIYGHGKISTAEWQRRLTEVFSERPAWEWERSIAREGGAAAVCRTREEWRAEPHCLDSELFVAGNGEIIQAGPAVRVFAAPHPADLQGVGAQESSGVTHLALRDEAGKQPLAGLRVVDMSIVLAGPTCGRILGELGAEVIKVDAPSRVVYPYRSPYGWLDVNRGKKSILLDLKTERGREIMWQLIATADILLENYRAGKIEELGFGFEAVARVKPSMVYVSLNAFDFGGEFTDRPGWEPNAQAITGMQVSRSTNGKPGRVPLAPNDYGTGLLGAYGTLLALRQVEKTGRAQHVQGSLARTATFLQTRYFDWAVDDGSEGGPEGPDVLFVQCSDGWVVGERRQGEAEPAGSDLSCAELIERWRRAGRQCGIVRTTQEVQGLEWVRQAGLILDWEHPHWGPMTNAFAHGVSDMVSQGPGWPAPDPGENTEEILRGLGYADEAIAELVGSGVVAGRAPLFES